MTCRVQQYGDQVRRVMQAMVGDAYWLVTDSTKVADLDLTDFDLAFIAKMLDPDNSLRLDISQGDYIADIAEKLCT